MSVSIHFGNTSLELPNGEQIDAIQSFNLTVASGERVKVIIEVPSSVTQGAYVQTTGAENAIKVLRAMLRGKKRRLTPR